MKNIIISIIVCFCSFPILNKNVFSKLNNNLLFGLLPFILFLIGLLNYKFHFKYKTNDLDFFFFFFYPFFFYCIFNIGRFCFKKNFKREPNPLKKGFSNVAEFFDVLLYLITFFGSFALVFLFHEFELN
jgi:hypothetical protein